MKIIIFLIVVVIMYIFFAFNTGGVIYESI